MSLPPCGLYRTRAPVAGIPAGRLVFFHNHGEPGPGLYTPTGWKHNRAQFADKGALLPDPSHAEQLEPLPAEGLYRVHEPFDCCPKRCRHFEVDMLVQLGFNASAEPILFVPRLIDGQLAIPERGSRIDEENLARITRLKLPIEKRQATVQ